MKIEFFFVPYDKKGLGGQGELKREIRRKIETDGEGEGGSNMRCVFI